MKKIRVILSLLLVFLLTIFCLVGCTTGNGSEKEKYDVRIKVVCTDGNEWIFDKDTDEISLTKTYTGRAHEYKVDGYQLIGHPTISKNKWITPSSPNGFYSSILYTDLEGKQDSTLKKVCEKGEYVISFRTNTTGILKYRWIKIRLTIG